MIQPMGWEFTKDGWSKDLPQNPEAGQIMMSMMTGYGDLKKVWNAANEDEVEDARRSFDHLVKKKRYMAFRIDPEDGTKGEQIREFDPKAGKMILVPAVAGG